MNVVSRGAVGLTVAVGVMVVGPTAGRAAVPALSQQLGGADGSVNAPDEVRAATKVILAAPSADSAATSLFQLTPDDRARVLTQGLEVVRVDVTPVASDPVVGAAAARRARRSLKARAAATTSHSFDAIGRDSVGLEIYGYRSRWGWTYNGRAVTSANHYESTTGTAPLWNYRGSRYLQPSGGIGQSYIGRETQGTFTLDVPVYGRIQTSYANIDVHVHGNGGWWYRWSTSGL